MSTLNLLLISNSRSTGGAFLQHCETALQEILGAASEVLFLPYALGDYSTYASLVRPSLEKQGRRLAALHEQTDPVAAIESAEAIFVGGGNTFRLLKTLYDLSLLKPLQQFAHSGGTFIGSSAGANIACPTIKTTNDMPIVFPPSLVSLGLVPFNINAHFIDTPDAAGHMGESRETRIHEFHELNSEAVVGLREGAWLRVKGRTVMLAGSTGARVFRQTIPPLNYDRVGDLSYLMQAKPAS